MYAARWHSEPWLQPWKNVTLYSLTAQCQWHHKPDGHPHYQSSLILGYHPFRGHRYLRERQWFARSLSVSGIYPVESNLRREHFVHQSTWLEGLKCFLWHCLDHQSWNYLDHQHGGWNLQVPRVLFRMGWLQSQIVNIFLLVITILCVYLKTWKNPQAGWNIQWGPADVHPLVLSPNWWTCMPRSALASWPVMSQVIVVGLLSDDCSKVTWPLTFESPRRTATNWQYWLEPDLSLMGKSCVWWNSDTGAPKPTSFYEW